VTIDGLPAGIPHRFGVVAEDLAGNRSAVTYTNDCVTPRAVDDFWEEYRRDGGQARPGACAVDAPGRGPSAGAALRAAIGQVARTFSATSPAAVSPGPKAMLTTGVPSGMRSSSRIAFQMCGTVAEDMFPR
jgi:hypothetical protein